MSKTKEQKKKVDICSQLLVDLEKINTVTRPPDVLNNV